MDNTFTNECDRKIKLFKAWNEYFEAARPEGDDFDELYEGLASVFELSKNFVRFQLADGRKLPSVSITSEISASTLLGDGVHAIFGRREGRWWILEIFSISSPMGDEKQVHMTFNSNFLRDDSAIN